MLLGPLNDTQYNCLLRVFSVPISSDNPLCPMVRGMGKLRHGGVATCFMNKISFIYFHFFKFGHFRAVI